MVLALCQVDSRARQVDPMDCGIKDARPTMSMRDSDALLRSVSATHQVQQRISEIARLRSEVAHDV